MLRRTKIILILCVVLLMTAGIFLLLFLSKLQILEIQGNTYYKTDKLKELLCKGRFCDNTFFLYFKLKYGDAPKIAFIDELETNLVNLNHLKVKVHEKDIIGAFPYMGEYVCFDREGIMAGSVRKPHEGVPVVEGIRYNSVRYGYPIGTDKPEIFDNILNLVQLIKKYELPIHKIEFGQQMEVKLRSEKREVLLGRRSHFDEQLSNLKEILEKTEGMKGSIHMEDYSALNRRVIFKYEK